MYCILLFLKWESIFTALSYHHWCNVLLVDHWSRPGDKLRNNAAVTTTRRVKNQLKIPELLKDNSQKMRESQFYNSWLIWRRRIYRRRHHLVGGLRSVVVLLPAVHERGDDVHRDREHNRAVFLRWDVVQGLQVSQLKTTLFKGAVSRC